MKIGCVQTDIIYFVVEVSKKVEDPRDNSKRLTSWKLKTKKVPEWRQNTRLKEDASRSIKNVVLI